MTVVLDTTAHASCGHKVSALPRAKPITVNGVTISPDAIAREAQNHPAAKALDAWLAAGRALVVRELLLQEGRQLGLTARPLEDDEGRRETEDEALIRAVTEQQVKVPAADVSSCRRIYEQQKSRFRSPDIREVRHILLPASPADPSARECARALATTLIADLVTRPDRFGELAAIHSACPSAKTGGHLGQISSGQTVPEFEAALANLPSGVVAPRPIETRYGFHVVSIERHIAGALLPFEVVHERIAQWLGDKARREAIRQYIEFLVARADITGITLTS
jgi:peptidyl-prolyl cis-trans isomerase C